MRPRGPTPPIRYASPSFLALVLSFTHTNAAATSSALGGSVTPSANRWANSLSLHPGMPRNSGSNAIMASNNRAKSSSVGSMADTLGRWHEVV